MTTKELHELHSVRPFKPFSIRLGDGQSLRVDHPEMLAYFEKARTATMYQKDGSFQIVDLLLMTGLEVHPPRNGKHKRARQR